MGKLLKIGEAAQYLSVSQDTLRKWDKANKLKPLETAGGHRRYDTDALDEFIGKNLVYKGIKAILSGARPIRVAVPDVL